MRSSAVGDTLSSRVLIATLKSDLGDRTLRNEMNELAQFSVPEQDCLATDKFRARGNESELSPVRSSNDFVP